jgi:hypothetical protein
VEHVVGLAQPGRDVLVVRVDREAGRIERHDVVLGEVARVCAAERVGWMRGHRRQADRVRVEARPIGEQATTLGVTLEPERHLAQQ